MPLVQIVTELPSVADLLRQSDPAAPYDAVPSSSESMSDLEQSTPLPTQLFVVRRGRESTFGLLTRQFGTDPTVHVIWDRRYRERRGAVADVRSERRNTDRRAPAPTVWPSINYIVVNVG
jgi:hypothetical protein